MYKDVVRRKDGKNLPIAVVAGLLALWTGVKFVGGIPLYIQFALKKFVHHSMGLAPFLLVSIAFLMFAVSSAFCCFVARRAMVPRTVEGTVGAVHRREVHGLVSIRMFVCHRTYTIAGRNLIDKATNPENWVGKRARLGIGALEMVHFMEIDE
jgi:hypothetical protein